MRKWTVEFLRKFENRGTKFARGNSILITKSINLQLFTLILCGVGVCCDRRRFSVFSQFIKSMPGSKVPINQYVPRCGFVSAGTPVVTYTGLNPARVLEQKLKQRDLWVLSKEISGSLPQHQHLYAPAAQWNALNWLVSLPYSRAHRG